ncbi:MAG: polysaccharide deacetylase family protein [Cyanobacteriota bacterium]|nr:polysaccharide deacetylase family protein [Cyanobacteriota bacterium]
MQFAPTYPLIYRLLSPTFPTCLWSGSRDRAEIALTFDDGPHPKYTPQLLDVLDRYGVQASFFWLGACVARSPDVARAVYQQGHWLGLHGYDHRSFPRLSPGELQLSLRRTQDAIARSCPLAPDSIRDVRPPNGLFLPKTLKLLHQWNYRPVMWTVVPEDWVRPGVERVVRRVLAQVGNGAIVVLHDGACGGVDVAHTTAALLPLLLERGYHFVTIDRFWSDFPRSSAKKTKARF